jgi:D-alanyl-D-alanine carboxypeptidase
MKKIRIKNPYVRSVVTAAGTAALIVILILSVAHAFSTRKNTRSTASVIIDTPGVNEEDPAGLGNDIELVPVASHVKKTIGADAYLVRDVASSTILFEKESGRALPVASLTKLVTAVVAELSYGPHNSVSITPEALGTEGNTGQFRLDETFSLFDIIHPLILVSSNDAAEAIARSYKPGRAAFIKEMNDWVYSIGAYHTSFVDPSGLSPKNISSADDTALILEWIYKNRLDLAAVLRMKSYASHTHTWINKTHFLNLSSYVAGKNGYIPEAKETAVALFNVNNRLYSVAVLGTKNRDKDVLELLQWIMDSGKK